MTDVIDVLNTQQPAAGDPLAALVGDGKKFKDVGALAAGKQAADDFIEQLQLENKEMRKAISELESGATKQRTLSEVIEALNQSKGGEQVVNQTQVTPEDIKRLVEAQVQQVGLERDEITSRKSNRAAVNKTVLSAFDNDTSAAANYIGDRAKALGLTTAQVSELADTSPAAFIAMLGLGAKTAPAAPASRFSTVNTAALEAAKPNTGERKLSYYQAKRKEMGMGAYFRDQRIQQAYRQDMKKYGEAFNDIEPI